jgi:molecular chaperone DnaK
MAADNKSLGKFVLDGLPPAPRGVPQIEVTFDIDANGILKVTAKDKATGRSQHITITASSGLSDAEVEKMRKDAEAHAEEDRKRKELIEVRNNADNTAYAAEKALKDFGDKVPADLKAEIETKVSDVREKAKSDDPAVIKSATEALGQVIQKIGAAAYQQAEPQPGAPSGEPEQGGQSNPGPDVVDGEVKE